METLSVSFFGHRRINNATIVEAKLEIIVREFLHRPEYIEFLVGRDGDFDLLVASTIKRCQRAVRDDNSALIWVLPYSTAELADNEEAFPSYYDAIEICEQSARSHYKSAFQMRNRSMVDRSDYIVFYVEHSSGGAAQTLRYAYRQGVNYINLAEFEV